MEKEKVLILGAGAQAKYIMEIFHILNNFEVEVIIDVNNKHRIGKKNYNVNIVLWDDKYLLSLIRKGFKKAIVAHGNNKRKEQLYKKAKEMGFELVSAVHPAATIASTAFIGENVIINAGAIIQPYAKVGNGVMVHAGVIIEHDCVIEDFVNLAPGVRLAGGVHVKKRAYIFTGALVIPQKTIEMDAIVGAGAVVIQDVPEKITVVGNPARPLEK